MPPNPNISLWHKDYVELIDFEKQQALGKFWKQSRGFRNIPLLWEKWTFIKKNLSISVSPSLYQQKKGDPKSQEDLISGEGITKCVTHLALFTLLFLVIPCNAPTLLKPSFLLSLVQSDISVGSSLGGLRNLLGFPGYLLCICEVNFSSFFSCFSVFYYRASAKNLEEQSEN